MKTIATVLLVLMAATLVMSWCVPEPTACSADVPILYKPSLISKMKAKMACKLQIIKALKSKLGCGAFALPSLPPSYEGCEYANPPPLPCYG